MKQFILICAACLLGFSNLLAKPITPPDGGGRLSVLLYLGHGRQCEGWGICDMDIVYISDVSVFGGGPGFGGRLQISPDNSHIELTFSRDDVIKYQPEKMVFLDGKSEVTFEEGFVFSDEVREGLEADKDLRINPGSYPLSFVDGLFTIKIPY